MAQSLVQSLEGITFPCNRSRLIEYARTHNAAPKALDSLEAIPAGSYANLTEVLTAVPSKSDVRRWADEAEMEEERERDEDRAGVDPMRKWVATSTEMWWRMWFPWLR